MRTAFRIPVIAALALVAGGPGGLRCSAESGAASPGEFDVVIAGGSTAALAAAIASAESGARTALIEPTDWVGGQLTSSGVPAVDEAWHTVTGPDDGQTADDVNVAAIARLPANITPNFLAALQALEDPGECWVSRYCFCPDRFLAKQLEPLIAACGDRLRVFPNAVVKSVEMTAEGTRIGSIVVIERTPRPGVAAEGYDRLPSRDLADWYSGADSDRFTKRTWRFGPAAAFIDATEWGEVLALSGHDFLQGVETREGDSDACQDRCGQATVYCFVQEYLTPADAALRPPVRRSAVPPSAEHGAREEATVGFGPYREKADAWNLIWTYRRIRGRNPLASPGDLCLQNWGYSGKLGEGGNDYPFGYLFVSRDEAARQRSDWQGGVDMEVLAAAERRAFAWHEWFRRHGPPSVSPDQIVLNGAVLGTSHGLAKLPYIRDTRRSIGLDGFVLRFADLTGPAAQVTGTKFADRVALGAYPADIHPISGCDMPAYVHSAHDTLPFYIPFRALTHGKIDNLLVAGKTMAQSFVANSATRLHPIEWSSGTAAGVAAAYMAKAGKTSRETYDSIAELQEQIRQRTPIDWSLPTGSAP